MTAVEVVVASGLLPDNVLPLMQKWKLIPQEIAAVPVLSSPEEIAKRFQEIIEGEDVVQLRDTDLDIAKQYLTREQRARLYVPTATGKLTFIEVYYCLTRLGEYVFAWRDDSLKDLLLDERTYLKTPEGKAYFSDARDLYFGAQRAFVVCTAAKVPHV